MKFNLSAFRMIKTGIVDLPEKLNLVVITNYIVVPHEASKEAMMGMEFPEFIVNGYIELNKGFECGFANISANNVELLLGQLAHRN